MRTLLYPFLFLFFFFLFFSSSCQRGLGNIVTGVKMQFPRQVGTRKKPNNVPG